ncbi:hypothetical protein ACLI1A_04895 [Flavobacterium sp. RHBU_3]|uniref:hypothetical protein n=1 Tax=Flavobacterium sp. RHBU_3 TaxID=3391184 RepID=UPI00398479B2
MKRTLLIVFTFVFQFIHAQQNNRLQELKPTDAAINTIVETVYNNSQRFMPDQRVYLMNFIKQNNTYDIRVALPPDNSQPLKDKKYTLGGYFMYNGIVVVVIGETGKLFTKTGDSISGAWLNKAPDDESALVGEMPVWQFILSEGKVENVENSTVNLFDK